MRTLKLALAAVAAFAFNASAATIGPANGMGSGRGGAVSPPGGTYQNQGAIDLGGGTFYTGSTDEAAFHAGGVAACDGCHVMHNANDGVAKSTLQGSAVAPWTSVTNAYLLQGTDQSSTCLICHSGAKTSYATGSVQFTVADVTTAAAPTNFTPGGDFGWLRASFRNSPGERHGHNVAAVDFGIGVDSKLTIAPGGSWVGGAGIAAFACSSCHDPHGRYRMQNDGSGGVVFKGPLEADSKPIAASGSYGDFPDSATADYSVGAYRLLGGKKYAPASNSAFPFPNNPPVAVAPRLYNNKEDAAEVRVAYGTGMSEWCQNCHTNIHLDGYTSGVSELRHPAGSTAFLHAGQINVYNTYIASGKVGANEARYTSLVPFEQGPNKKVGDLAQAITDGMEIKADAESAVMCLSCHRAHASAFDSMVRWDQNATFLTDGAGFTAGITADKTAVGAAATGTKRSAAQTTAGYYARTTAADPADATEIGLYQRSLCNKCHGKD